jgi:hypothetical protein
MRKMLDYFCASSNCSVHGYAFKKRLGKPAASRHPPPLSPNVLTCSQFYKHSRTGKLHAWLLDVFTPLMHLRTNSKQQTFSHLCYVICRHAKTVTMQIDVPTI